MRRRVPTGMELCAHHMYHIQYWRSLTVPKECEHLAESRFYGRDDAEPLAIQNRVAGSPQAATGTHITRRAVTGAAEATTGSTIKPAPRSAETLATGARVLMDVVAVALAPVVAGDRGREVALVRDHAVEEAFLPVRSYLSSGPLGSPRPGC